MKALTVGSAMIDTIAIMASDSIERMSMRNAESSFLLLEEGRKTDALEVSTHCGGGAINTAVAMSRLGLDVATLVKVGRDAAGRDNSGPPDGGTGLHTLGAARRAQTDRRIGADFVARPQCRDLHLSRRQHTAGAGRPARRDVRRRSVLYLQPQQQVRRMLPAARASGPRPRVRWLRPTPACGNFPLAAGR